MPDFKKLLEEEIDTVFLDDDIFAEERDINGKPMKVVICDDTLKENKKLYVKKKDFGRRPKIGNPVTVDEMEYFIQNFDEQAGMYALTIYLRRQ